MKSRCCAMLLLIAAIAAAFSGTAFGETVVFRSSEIMVDTKPPMLTGELVRPAGEGPFPAVVLLHPCSGINRGLKEWADAFVNWGYAALIVDSFGPRGIKEVCTDASLSLSYSSKRAQDAYDARAYLASLSFIDSGRIAVIGWSHGAWTVLEVLRREAKNPFQAAIAFYPYCDLIRNLNAPVLILIGNLDDWTPAALCRKSVAAQESGPEIALKVYPEAHHGFDIQGADIIRKGARGISHRIKYDKEAAADARVQVKGFLEKYLK